MNQHHDKRRSFARRVGKLRVMAFLLAAPCIASALYVNSAPLTLWLLSAAMCFVWPALAMVITRRSRDPAVAEYRNLTLDGAATGALVAVMHFNLLPSVLVVAMLWLSECGVGGWRLALRALAPMVGACVLVSWSLGFAFDPTSTMLNVYGSIPYLVAYPAVTSLVMYSLARRVSQQNALLEDLNRTDVLTGLPNRQCWEKAAAAELERCLRTGRASALLIIDVDSFKSVNDLYGHLVGDEALVSVAHALRDSVRSIDTAGRYAGDEFGIVLAEADLAGAVEVAERARARIEALRFASAPLLRVTVSIGIAEAGGDIRELKTWIHEADTALYRSKRAGRNRVMSPHDIPRRRVAAASAIVP